MTDQPTIQGSVYKLPFLSAGVSSMVYELSNEAVIKAPCGTDISQRQLNTERDIFYRLGPHPHIVKLLDEYDGMIILERLQQYPLRKRLWDLRDTGEVPPSNDVIRWALQIAQALDHANLLRVFQVDIGTYNMLLDDSGNVKLADFAGSSIDGTKPTVYPSAHCTHPALYSKGPSIYTEAFSFGCAVYEMETTRVPYQDKTEGQVKALFKAKEFPDTSTLVLGEVITKCVREQYKSLGDAVTDIKRIQDNLSI